MSEQCRDHGGELALQFPANTLLKGFTMHALAEPISRAIAKTFTRLGYTVSSTWRLPNRALAMHLRDLLTVHSVDCVLDVGANDGQYARFLRDEVDFQGTILSFEPIAGLAASCRERANRDPNWHIQQVAIGDEDTDSEINVMAVSQFSSFLDPSTDTTKLFAGANAVDHKEKVSVRRLDGLLPELQRQHGFTRPYLKIDTQGFDLNVIRGAGSLLTTIVALQTELSFRSIYHDAPSWQDALELLRERGFSVSNIFVVNLEQDLRAIEFDCILMNDQFASLPPPT
jgi:FkbM family methyltransferase